MALLKYFKSFFFYIYNLALNAGFDGFFCWFRKSFHFLVKMPGIVQQTVDNKVALQLDPDLYEAVNVTCVAECEIKKSDLTENYSHNINEVKVKVVTKFYC